SVHPGVTARLLAAGKTAQAIQADVTFPPTTPAGVYQLSLKSSAGQTASLPFTVDLFPLIEEKEPNDSPSTGQAIALPATVAGSMNRAGDVDYFRFDARAGQQVGVQVLTGAAGSKLEPVLQMVDGAGRVVAESNSGALGHICEKAGTYSLGIR